MDFATLNIGWIIQKQLLLFQLGHELGPPDVDRIAGGLGHGGEGKGFKDRH